MDVSEEEGDNDYESRSKGSSQGENSLDSVVTEEHDDISDDSTDESDDVLAACFATHRALRAQSKQLLERILTERNKSTVFHTMKVLNNLTGLRMWSPFYIASMGLIQVDGNHRKVLLVSRDPEDKICYLEYKTGKKRDE